MPILTIVKYVISRSSFKAIVFCEGVEILQVIFKVFLTNKRRSLFFKGDRLILEIVHIDPFFFGRRKYSIVEQHLDDVVNIIEENGIFYLDVKNVRLNITWKRKIRFTYSMYKNDNLTFTFKKPIMSLDYPSYYTIDLDDNDDTALYQIIWFLQNVSFGKGQ